MSDLSVRAESEWRLPPGQIRLSHNDVHVWRADLQAALPELDRWQALLSDDERQRAKLFQLPELRRRFIAAHGILRELLAIYLQVSPRWLRFEQNRHGKPFLLPDSSVQLHFNLTHSDD